MDHCVCKCGVECFSLFYLEEFATAWMMIVKV